MTILNRTFPPFRPERLFSVEEYLRMGEAGILTERDQVELLNGRIVEKMSRNPPHDSAISRLSKLLVQLVSLKHTVRPQAALRMSSSVPEPDIAVVRGPDSQYDRVHPAAADAFLVVEVSESTLSDDQGEMAAMYASDSIPVYWIVNLVDQRVEVYTDPTGADHFPNYRQRKDVGLDGTLSLSLPGLKKVVIKVRDFFPASL